MTDRGVEFGTLRDDGSYVRVRSLHQSAIAACPHVIMVAEHYRDDESCRCDDPTHVEMAEWGYTWSDATRRWE